MNCLPVADASADVFWATAAVHHSWDLGRTFVEAARVLKPGGWLYLCCEPMPSFVRHAVGHSFGEAERSRGINERWIRRSEWLAHCRRASLIPELLFPEFDRAALAAKLSHRGVPVALAPLIKPLLRSLQVSIHLVAQKPGG
jgi:SAM-dependent methyltransferase